MSFARTRQPSVRIARVITRLNIGGPSIQATALTTLLECDRRHTRLFYGKLAPGEGDMRYLLAADADTRWVPTLCRPLSPVEDIRALVRLYREFRAFRPMIVHTHMAKAGLVGRLAASVYNATRGAAPRARVVHTYHGHVLEGYFSPLMSRVFVTLERLLARVSDALVAISPAIRDELLHEHRIGRSTQYRVIPLGFNLAPFAAIDDEARVRARRALGIDPDRPVVTTVGRLTAIKRPHLFLDTVAHVLRRHPRVTALVAGDGELREDAQAYARTLGIDGHVNWLGWRQDLATIYGATDVFLLTSRNEGTPVALIEAMASGVAGVSTDVGGVKDVIDSPEAGVLAPFGDVSALADGVERLLDDAARRRRMGECARARVIDRFSRDRLVAEITSLYDELLEAR